MEKTGKNLTDLLDLNRAQIMDYLVKHPGCSRAELGEYTGLTLASITKIIRSLLECGAVYETGYAEGKKGRRSVGLSFNYEKYKILAIRLSWSGLKIQPYDFLGNTYGELVSLPVQSVTMDHMDSIIQTIAIHIASFCTRFPDIAAIGIATPGPCYKDVGLVMLPPYHIDPEKRLYYPLKERLSAYTNLPIFMEHDADAGALAYWWFPPANENNTVIMNVLTDGGVGIGLVDNGHVFTGISSASCEMGHISIDYSGRACPHCGSRGCLNAYCSTQALEQIAKELLPQHPDSLLYKIPNPTCQNILDAAIRQDAFAMDLFFQCGQNMGRGILSLLHIFNPSIIVISGSISLGGDFLMDGIQDVFNKGRSVYTIIPRIKLLTSNKQLTLLGAATTAIASMLSEPTQYLSLSTNN